MLTLARSVVALIIVLFIILSFKEIDIAITKLVRERYAKTSNVPTAVRVLVEIICVVNGSEFTRIENIINAE